MYDKDNFMEQTEMENALRHVPSIFTLCNIHPHFCEVIIWYDNDGHAQIAFYHLLC